VRDRIERSFRESLRVKEALLSRQVEAIEAAARALADALRSGGKILIFGNGGSAADAQHIAGELVGRYLRERRSLPAISLTTDTSILTAVGNDLGFENVFARQIEGLGRRGDVAWGISTSGRSPNVLEALKKARNVGMVTLGLTGGDGGGVKDLVDHWINVPSGETPRIQESHILVGHVLCELVEEETAGG
jgi:D-sedoheptulose 7-phosphate isomerase